MTLQADVIVLGAGVVGTCAAIDLQTRGRRVLLIDRHEGAGRETSSGNAGLIERASIFPYMFPHDLRLFWRYARNAAPEAHYHACALPALAPWLWTYFWNSAPGPAARIAAAARPLIERSLAEHERLAARAGVSDALRRTGWIKLFRTSRRFAEGAREAERLRAFGLSIDAPDGAALAALEPALLGDFAGALHFRDPASVADPQALVEAYAALLDRQGGLRLVGDARTLQRSSDVWFVETREGRASARDVVVALGPWSNDLLRPLGYRIPLAVKRGYHVHFRPQPGATLIRPVHLAEGGFVLSPMTRGLRMTTGAEFARRDAPPTPVQIDEAEPLARALAPLGPRVEPQPWMGSRPCLPDMLPVIGGAPRHPGLWFDFGHQHHGLTLAPVCARLLGEIMTGEEPFTDPRPYRAERF